MQSAKKGLPEHQRKIIMYRFVEGWTVTDVAEELGLTPRKVHKRTFRARHSLKQKLKKYRIPN